MITSLEKRVNDLQDEKQRLISTLADMDDKIKTFKDLMTEKSKQHIQNILDMNETTWKVFSQCI